ncbi:MAG: TetR/AcrR family transcriptional regulator [Methylococcales bacterium]|nr:TetR/AcrR family transcriptional regulator [Methylococcales bacterium]
MDKEKNNQNKPDIKDEILLVALHLFSQQGFHNTALKDIAQAIGAKTTSLIYQHYENKQAIAQCLYDTIIDNLNVSIDEIRRRTKKPSEQLREIVGLLFRLRVDAPEVLRFLYFTNISEILPAVPGLLKSPPYQKILKVMQAGMRCDEIKNLDPVFAYAAFFGIIEQTLRLSLQNELTKDLDVSQSQAWLLAWSVISKKN